VASRHVTNNLYQDNDQDDINMDETVRGSPEYSERSIKYPNTNPRGDSLLPCLIIRVRSCSSNCALGRIAENANTKRLCGIVNPSELV